jgi:orotidine-5'-phosphate decarboxylase
MTSRLIVALDTADIAQASEWVKTLTPHAGMFKIGLEYFLAHGAAGFRALGDVPVFLDLKLHDIPTTVRGAVRSLLHLRPRMLTVHSSGGAAMISAARDAAGAASGPSPLILAVTVLTSLDQAGLNAVGVFATPAEQVVRLGQLAIDAGADGLVCSPLEVAPLRRALGASVTLVVPGIRPLRASADDQARTMTPRDAVAAGADWIVVGRPITAAPDPTAAAAAILSEVG